MLWFGVTTLRARPILRWAVGRTLGSLRLLVPLVTRALPLLLLFVTFLFINAEVWELSSTLDGGVLWMVVMLFGLLAAGFLLVRLPEELDASDHAMDEIGLVEACRGPRWSPERAPWWPGTARTGSSPSVSSAATRGPTWSWSS